LPIAGHPSPDRIPVGEAESEVPVVFRGRACPFTGEVDIAVYDERSVYKPLARVSAGIREGEFEWAGVLPDPRGRIIVVARPKRIPAGRLDHVFVEGPISL